MPLKASSIFRDTHGTRYQLLKQTPGKYNWIFVPGGPGIDSCYFLPLIEKLLLSGKVWLIDLPANGTNKYKDSMEFPFDKWGDCLVEAVKQFDNSIYVGHSFSGTLALQKPELETLLTKMILIGTSPIAGKFEPQEPDEIVLNFQKNPDPDSFEKLLMTGLPLHFPFESRELGRQFFRDIVCNYHAINWWISRIRQNKHRPKWLPKNLPTRLIVGSKDLVCPLSPLLENPLLKKANIQIAKIEGAGHFPWIDKLETTCQCFDNITESPF